MTISISTSGMEEKLNLILIMIKTHARAMAKQSWKKSPKSKEQLSEIAKMGWTEERRESQRERMRLINKMKYDRKTEEENEVS